MDGLANQEQAKAPKQQYARKTGRASHECASLHFTVAVWANCDPKFEFGPSWLKKDSVKALVSAAVCGPVSNRSVRRPPRRSCFRRLSWIFASRSYS